MIKVVFVCLGNICRSPMAEAIFATLVRNKGLEASIVCDSAGTAAYHIGDRPDHRTIKVLQENGIQTWHLGRQLGEYDFHEFDYILTMDLANYKDAKAIQPTQSKAELKLMLDHGQQIRKEVPDPYYGNMSSFEEVYQLLWDSCGAFLDDIIQKHGLGKMVE